jgi:hypothetical protein
LRAIAEKYAELKRDPNHIEYLCEVDGYTADDMYTYNQVLDFIESDNLDIESDTEQFIFSVASALIKVYCVNPIETTMSQPTISLLNGRAGRQCMSHWIPLTKMIQYHALNTPNAMVCWTHLVGNNLSSCQELQEGRAYWSIRLSFTPIGKKFFGSLVHG